MWNGAFSPLRKHRDYLHDSFYEHAKATGGGVEVIPTPVFVAVDPITEQELDEDTEYYVVVLTLHNGDAYPFLIISDTPGMPDEEEIEEQITRYIKNPVPGGRRLEDYVSDITINEVGVGALASEYVGVYRTSQLFAS